MRSIINLIDWVSLISPVISTWVFIFIRYTSKKNLIQNYLWEKLYDREISQIMQLLLLNDFISNKEKYKELSNNLIQHIEDKKQTIDQIISKKYLMAISCWTNSIKSFKNRSLIFSLIDKILIIECDIMVIHYYLNINNNESNYEEVIIENVNKEITKILKISFGYLATRKKLKIVNGMIRDSFKKNLYRIKDLDK